MASSYTKTRIRTRFKINLWGQFEWNVIARRKNWPNMTIRNTYVLSRHRRVLLVLSKHFVIEQKLKRVNILMVFCLNYVKADHTRNEEIRRANSAQKSTAVGLFTFT